MLAASLTPDHTEKIPIERSKRSDCVNPSSSHEEIVKQQVAQADSYPKPCAAEPKNNLTIVLIRSP
jgi:hypothetical protein